MSPVSFVLPPRELPAGGYYIITRQQLIDALSMTSSPGTPDDAITGLADAILYELRGHFHAF